MLQLAGHAASLRFEGLRRREALLCSGYYYYFIIIIIFFLIYFFYVPSVVMIPRVKNIMLKSNLEWLTFGVIPIDEGASESNLIERCIKTETL